MAENISVVGIIGRLMTGNGVEYDWAFLITALLVLGVCLGLVRFVYRVLHRIIQSKFPENAAGATLLDNILKFVAILIAAAMILDIVFGVDATGIVTALGVTSVVVSFGLQDTVANLAAGIILMMHKIFGIGDTIEVGEFRGVVQDLTWRETTILDFNGDTQSIPNKLFNSTTVNVLSESNRVRHIFEIQVRFDADLNQVAHEICVKADAALDEAGMRMPKMPTRVFFLGSTAYGVTCSIRVYLKEEPMRTPARDCVMRAIQGSPWFADCLNERDGGAGSVAGDAQVEVESKTALEAMAESTEDGLSQA